MGAELVGFVFVELQDALHLDFQQSQEVVACHLTDKVFLERFQSLVNIFQCGIGRLCILKLPALVDAFLDENLLERTEVELLQQFVAPYLQFALNEMLGIVHRTA